MCSEGEESSCHANFHEESLSTTINVTVTAGGRKENGGEISTTRQRREEGRRKGEEEGGRHLLRVKACLLSVIPLLNEKHVTFAV